MATTYVLILTYKYTNKFIKCTHKLIKKHRTDIFNTLWCLAQKVGEAGGQNGRNKELYKQVGFMKQGGLRASEKEKVLQGRRVSFVALTPIAILHCLPSNSETSLRDPVLVSLILYPPCLVQCLAQDGHSNTC